MMTLIFSGGPVMWVIAVVGLVATGIFFVRFFDLRNAHVAYVDFMAGVENLLVKKNDREALVICDETPAPVTRVAAAAIRHRSATAEVRREAVDAALHVEVRRFSRRLSVLQTVAQISPLLGLFGTVVGFAHALMAVSGETLVTRTSLLPLMGPALVCAAAGLLVAVLVHVMHALLRARLEHLTADLDAAVTAILAQLGESAK
jgi:biopolymer transport protein ExbB